MFQNNLNFIAMENPSKNETKVEKVEEGVFRKVYYLNNIMTAILDYTEGPMDKPDPVHTHENEQISYIAKGQLFLIIGDKKKHLKKGDVYYIPSNIPHSIQILSKNVRIVDSYSPIREDLLNE
jgi:quercetin dioxygenase-like cupin family protein